MSDGYDMDDIGVLQEAGAAITHLLLDIEVALPHAQNWAQCMGFTPEPAYSIVAMREYMATIEEACKRIASVLDEAAKQVDGAWDEAEKLARKLRDERAR